MRSSKRFRSIICTISTAPRPKGQTCLNFSTICNWTKRGEREGEKGQRFHCESVSLYERNASVVASADAQELQSAFDAPFLLLATTDSGADTSTLKCILPFVQRQRLPPQMKTQKKTVEKQKAQNSNRQSIFFHCFVLYAALATTTTCRLLTGSADYGRWPLDASVVVPKYSVLFFFRSPFSKKLLDVTSFIRLSVEVSCRSVALYVPESPWCSIFHCEKCLRRQNIYHHGGKRISCLSFSCWH